MTSSAPALRFFRITVAAGLVALFSCASDISQSATAAPVPLRPAPLAPATAYPPAKPVPLPAAEPAAQPEAKPPIETEADRFTQIDRQVRNLSPSDQRTIPNLITALAAIARTDREKTRAVYIWITGNIAYDTDSYFRGIPGAYDASGVFLAGKSVCEGYSNLFLELAAGLNLEAVKIHGYAKGYSYREGTDPGGTNHAWNAVRIDGEWQLFDATWGSGHVDGKDFHFSYQEFYFDTPPDQFIFTHLPSDPAFQLLDHPVTRSMFFCLPRLDGDDFSAGIKAAEVRSHVESGGVFGMPTIYSSGTPATLEEFPMRSVLSAGTAYRIVIKTQAPFVVVTDGSGGKETMVNKNGTVVIQRSFPRGHMGIYLAPMEARDIYSHKYNGFLEYQVN